MHIERFGVAASPLGSDFSRLEVTIAALRPRRSLDYWFDLPSDVAPSGPVADALVLLMLPLACFWGETVRLDQPVDALLVENLTGVQQVWQSWYPELACVHIDAPTRVGNAPCRSPGTLASFSGGVDSFFSLLRHRHRITHLVSVAGFNTAMDDVAPMCEVLARVAAVFGKRHVPIVTNVRFGKNPPTPYSINELMNKFAHGCLLAALAHLMDAHVGTYIIPASSSYAHLHPWGSHPLTDPLFSSAALDVVHDGAAFGRLDRTALVASSDAALSSLHVCFNDFAAGNCSSCQKCLRTMATLDLLGVREQAVSFDWTKYSLERLASAWLSSPNVRIYFQEIARHAHQRGRVDLARALDAAVTASARKARVVDGFQAVKTPVIRAIKSNRLTAAVWHGLRALRGKRVRSSA